MVLREEWCNAEGDERADIEYEIQAHDAELRALLKSMEKKIPACREMSIVKTKLEEASMWLCRLQEGYLAMSKRQVEEENNGTD